MKTKTLFIKAKSKLKANPEKILSLSKSLPKNLALTYSIQFQDIATDIKKILSKNHKITAFTQVLGCSKPRFSKDTQAILLISSGKFHAISLAFETKLPVYILNRDKLEQISPKDIDLIAKKQKASFLKFLNADQVGILISTKPGQNKLKKALDLKKQLKKKSYLFMSNNINTSEFENFQSIQSWINTACPRMDLDSNTIINIDKVSN